jgi:cytochrome c peroxidase
LTFSSGNRLYFVAVLAATFCFIFMLASWAYSNSAPLVSDENKITALPMSERLDPKKVGLGSLLFDDPIMSSRGAMACSSCHDLSTSGTINVKLTVGYEGRTHRFNAPTIFNVANNYRLGWRGNFTSLAAQNEQVLLDPNLMGNNWQSLLDRLRAEPRYERDFHAIYGRAPDRESVLDVLVNFQRSLATPNSRFDLFLAGNAEAISMNEKRGYELFQDYGCISCHQGSNIGGNLFQKFGVFAEPPGGGEGDGDLGRFTATRNDADRGFFRVPSLRNVAVTAPYFHDGRSATLQEAVQIMARVQVGQDIPDRDIKAILDFLNTLTGEYNGVALRNGPPTPAGRRPIGDTSPHP